MLTIIAEGVAIGHTEISHFWGLKICVSGALTRFACSRVYLVNKWVKARTYAGIFSWGGGQDLQYCRGNASEGAKRPSGGRVNEVGVGCPPSQTKELLHFWDWNWTIWCTLWVDFLGEIVSKKVRRKYIFMENVCFLNTMITENVCFLNTMITGNVKSKHKQYDNWHSQDFF